jgi:hypothetical protein
MATVTRKLNLGTRSLFRTAGIFALLTTLTADVPAQQSATSGSTPAMVGRVPNPANGGGEGQGMLEVTPAGEWLAKSLDKLDVTHHWLRGTEHVAWRSGVPLLEEHGKKLTPLAKDETHCSAFAAAAADQLGIYLLHPPEHSHVLLANAQHDWLPSAAGVKAGWCAVENAVDAQRLANAGELVVAAFKNPDPTLAGHIAIIRPAAKSVAAILAKGPQITQAGFNNYASADLANGFDHHPGAWDGAGRGGVRFYAHAVTAEGLAGE